MEYYNFTAEEEETSQQDKETYKMLIVDDDEDVHNITKTALLAMSFDKFNVEAISAYSAEEAKQLLEEDDDIAIALVDVVMETHNAGLDLVNYIRNDLKNNTIRLVIRTGQASSFPSIEVINNYNINDFKEKTELTLERLYITIRSAIREYSQLLEIKKKNIDAQLSKQREIINMIAHQWRQPLSSITSMIASVKLQSELKSYDLSKHEDALLCQKEINEKMDKIELTVKNLSMLINDFKHFHSADKEMTRATLKDMVLESLEVVQPLFDEINAEIITEIKSDHEVSCVRNEIVQALLSILQNSNENFREKNIENPQIKIEIDANRIHICDNGGGVDKNIMQRMFDPYYSTKKTKQGAGLGLYMSKTIIEEHHNGLLYAKNKGSGICFTIEL